MSGCPALASWAALAARDQGRGRAPLGPCLDAALELPQPARAVALAALRTRYGRHAPRAPGERLLARCAAHGVRLVHPEDPAYPAALGQHPGAPLALYLRGAGDLTGTRCVAVTGSRRLRPRARLLARSLGALCRALGLTLVAGLASAAERAAVQGALAGEGCGRVLLVMPYGLDRDHPAGSRELVREVLRAGGAAAGLVPPGAGYRPGVWDARNRLLALLADDLVVVEAGAASGSLKAARTAAEAGVEVWVPRDPGASPLGAGTRALADGGATVFEHPLQLVWPRLAEVPARPAAVLALEQAGALPPDALLAAAGLLGPEDLDALLAAGWLAWTGDGRLVPDYRPLLEAMSGASRDLRDRGPGRPVPGGGVPVQGESG